MGKKKTPIDEAVEETAKQETAEKETEEVKEENKEEVKEEAKAEPTELEKAQKAQAQEHEQYLRLAAEYDNFRKRTQREKDAIYQDAVSDTAKKFLPVYDNLERALKAETADEAFRKGVELTMVQLKEILKKLGVTEIEDVGKKFDPAMHNAVMHVEDDTLDEGIVVEEFEKGFMLGDKVVRFSMVKVAN